MYRKLLTFILGITTIAAMAQNAKQQKFSFPLQKIFIADSSSIDWFANVMNLEPIEGNSIYRKAMAEVKAEVEKRFPVQNSRFIKKNIQAAEPFTINKQYQANPFSGGSPLDNTLAVSNDGTLISGSNTLMCFFDTQKDSLLKTISLTTITEGMPLSSHQYDPKLLYDHEKDRFIMVFLAGSDTVNTAIVVGFSQTKDPMGKWNFYAIDGNPLHDGSWFDYPALCYTKDELFITGNLLKQGGTWQTSFKQSIIWQVDKAKGYQGDTLQTKLWYDIGFKDNPLRNICPVQGVSTLQDETIYLLSNRNFDIQNDTTFLIQVNGKLNTGSASLNVKPARADKAYGMPPNAPQKAAFTNTLATNDARVLGAILQNNKIQFVANSIDTVIGKSAVYFGMMQNMSSPSVKAQIISDTAYYFGYPNIASTATRNDDDQVIIGFEYSDYNNANAGYGGIFYGNGQCSDYTIIKKGKNIIDVTWGNERWGDYTGIQRKHNEPGTVWCCGTYGDSTKKNSTWVASVYSPYPSSISHREKSIPTTRIYPNPATERVYIDFEAEKPALTQVNIFDIHGRFIAQIVNQSVKKGKNQLSFATQPLAAGTYIVQIVIGNKIYASHKIIVN